MQGQGDTSVSPGSAPSGVGAPNAPSSSGSFDNQIRAAREGSLTCASSEACNPAVVMISAVTRLGVVRCSGALISADHIITNDHCLNKTLQVIGNTSCVNKIFVHFAGSKGLSPLTISCASIDYRSGVTGIDSKDFTLIKLTEKVTDRDPIKLATRGFYQHEAATVFRVQMTESWDGQLDGVQTPLECKAVYQTLLYPDIQNEHFPLMTFGNCPVTFGNSGSAVLNSDGELGAVAQGFLGLDASPRIQSELAKVALKPTQNTIAIGTQVACMSQLNPVSARGCSPLVRAYGPSPLDFVKKYSRSPLSSRIAEGWAQVQSSSRAPLFARIDQGGSSSAPGASSCLVIQPAQSSVRLSVSPLIQGINENYELEWGAAQRGEVTTTFQVKNLNGPEAELYNEQIGSVRVPVCAANGAVAER